MTYVVDPSVAVKVVIPEADSARAVRLRDEYRNGIHTLIAPDLFASEVANALVTAERQGRINRGEAAQFLHELLLNAPHFFHTNPLLPRAMEMALAHRRAVYDCVYLALAEREGCELVTADDQFARGLRAHFPFIVTLLSLP